MNQIPNEFGLVILVIGISHFMNIYLTILVAIARKEYKVDYPTLYLEQDKENSKEYNSVQRAH